MRLFDKIIGYESIKKELFQIIDMFKNKDKYEAMGAKLPKGLIIYGEPGLGKTMLAEALIEECGVKAITVKNSASERDLIREINNAFIEASKLNSSIVFFDDLDKFSESDDEDVDDKIFVSIQANIDNVKDKNVLVMATVNNIRKLPNSLKRNGRFDKKLGIKSPTSEEAAKIIKYYLQQKLVNKDLNYEDVSKMINYTSCADLETILNESAIIATYSRKESIDINDIVKAFLKNMYNIQDDNLMCTNEALYSTCLHEAGHAVIAEVIKKGSVGFLYVQGTKWNNIEGFTHLCEDITRRPENVLISLGGKVACELFYKGICASGCQSDLEKASILIRDGLSKNGTYGIGLIDVSNGKYSNTSENYNARNEAVTQAELERFMFIAKDILFKNKDFLFKLTKELEEKKHLLFSDIQRIRNSVQITNVSI